jgi:hypothetical protein
VRGAVRADEFADAAGGVSEGVPAGETDAGGGGLEVVGEVGFAAEAGGEVGVAGGVDEHAGADGAASGFVFDEDGFEASGRIAERGGGGELGVEIDFDADFAGEFVEFDFEFLGVEGEAA